MSNSSDISNFDIFDNTPFQNSKCNALREPPGSPSLTTSRTVFLISLWFWRYSDLLVRCFASLDRPCFAFARPRGRDRGSIDLLGAVLIGPGVAHQVGPSLPSCDIPETLRPVLVAPALTSQSQNKLSIASCSQTAQQVNNPCQSSTSFMLSFSLNTLDCNCHCPILWEQIVYHSPNLIYDCYWCYSKDVVIFLKLLYHMYHSIAEVSHLYLLKI